MQENKKALVLLNMGGARDKSELKMFLTNMFNDENILTIKNAFIRKMVASFITNPMHICSSNSEGCDKQ